jgi:hypothetical protein
VPDAGGRNRVAFTEQGGCDLGVGGVDEDERGNRRTREECGSEWDQVASFQ